MTTPTSFQTLVTPAPRLHNALLFKRDNGDTICGDLRGAYPNVQAPVCAGATSICTFSQGLQGCCDSDDSCQFYTTCIGHYDSATCTGSQCLGCTDSAPYCIKYNFWDISAHQEFDGYSCGIFQDTSTIFGAATSVPITAAAETTFSLTSSISLSASAISTSTTSPSASESLTSFSSATSSSSSTDTSSTSVSPSATATGALTPESKSVSHTGATVGGVLGGLAGLALLGFVSYFVYTRFFRNVESSRLSRVGDEIPEVQQRYNA